MKEDIHVYKSGESESTDENSRESFRNYETMHWEHITKEIEHLRSKDLLTKIPAEKSDAIMHNIAMTFQYEPANRRKCIQEIVGISGYTARVIEKSVHKKISDANKRADPQLIDDPIAKALFEKAKQLVLEEQYKLDVYSDEMYFWSENDKRYVRLDKKKTRMDKTIVKGLGDFNTVLKSGLRQGFMRFIDIHAMEQFDELKKPNRLFACKSATFDLDTKQDGFPNKDVLLLNTIPHKIGTQTKTPKLDKFLEQVVGKENVQQLKDIMFYCTIPDNPLKLVFFLYGPQNSGKSTFLNVLVKFIGMHNTSTTTMHHLTDPKQRFEIVNHKDKLITICSENDKNGVYENSAIKRFRGNDIQRGEKKGLQDQIIFSYKGKLLVATNDLPRFRDEQDSATLGSCKIVEFPNTFKTSSERIEDTIDKKEFEALTHQCFERITEWARNGSDGIKIDGLPSWDERVKEYQHKSNPLIPFIEKYIEFDNNVDDPLDSEDFVFIFTFRETFNSYLQERGKPTWDDKKIGRALKKNFEGKYDKSKAKSPSDESKFWNTYKGMRWKK